MMVVMPAPAGLNNATGKQRAGDQEREDSSQFGSHGCVSPSVPGFVIFFPASVLLHPVMTQPRLVLPHLPTVFLTAGSALAPLNLVDRGPLRDGCPSAWCDCQSAKDR